MIARRVLYEGRVQGVGFRYTVRRLAMGFEVTGWVKNLDDGRVELQVVGEAQEVRAFLEAIRESELKSHIRAQQENELATVNGVKGFEIKF